MATANHHYTRAEDIMDSLAQAADDGATLPAPFVATLIAQAQVHATLALVAVQAEATRGAAVMLDPRPRGGAQ